MACPGVLRCAQVCSLTRLSEDVSYPVQPYRDDGLVKSSLNTIAEWTGVDMSVLGFVSAERESVVSTYKRSGKTHNGRVQVHPGWFVHLHLAPMEHTVPHKDTEGLGGNARLHRLRRPPAKAHHRVCF